MKEARLRFTSKQQPPSNKAAEKEAEFPSASGVAQEQIADTSEEPWVVVWHPREENALHIQNGKNYWRNASFRGDKSRYDNGYQSGRSFAGVSATHEEDLYF